MEEGRVTDFSKFNADDGDGDDEDEYEDVDKGLFAYRWHEGAAIRDLDSMRIATQCQGSRYR
jgi:hypothetical protein